jgi:hypothetical protein
VRKINSASAGKCMAVAMACAGVAAKQVKVWHLFSFPTRHKASHTCGPCIVVIMKLAHAIARVLKTEKNVD